jgi:hypothetical protein
VNLSESEVDDTKSNYQKKHEGNTLKEKSSVSPQVQGQTSFHHQLDVQKVGLQRKSSFEVNAEVACASVQQSAGHLQNAAQVEDVEGNPTLSEVSIFLAFLLKI